MNKFRNLGFISYNGKIEVHRSLLNAVLHDRPKAKDKEGAGADHLCCWWCTRAMGIFLTERALF